jgi:hypothetical protein
MVQLTVLTLLDEHNELVYADELIECIHALTKETQNSMHAPLNSILCHAMFTLSRTTQIQSQPTFELYPTYLLFPAAGPLGKPVGLGRPPPPP